MTLAVAMLRSGFHSPDTDTAPSTPQVHKLQTLDEGARHFDDLSEFKTPNP